MSLEHQPPKPAPGDKRKFVFVNRNAYNIRITHFHFESSRHPRQWDTYNDEIYVDKDNGVHTIPIVGPGQIFLRWKDGTSDRGDTFEVQFDLAGEPYPYIFGGDRWTMALRHKALRAVAEHGNN